MSIKSKPTNNAYRANFDRIFKKKEPSPKKPKLWKDLRDLHLSPERVKQAREEAMRDSLWMDKMAQADLQDAVNNHEEEIKKAISLDTQLDVYTNQEELGKKE